MRKPPMILVAGLGRCGSSLMMQMLHAAGMPCVGSAPDLRIEVEALTAAGRRAAA